VSFSDCRASILCVISSSQFFSLLFPISFLLKKKMCVPHVPVVQTIINNRPREATKNKLSIV
jgi:hypothetical protein